MICGGSAVAQIVGQEEEVVAQMVALLLPCAGRR